MAEASQYGALSALLGGSANQAAKGPIARQAQASANEEGGSEDFFNEFTAIQRDVKNRGDGREGASNMKADAKGEKTSPPIKMTLADAPEIDEAFDEELLFIDFGGVSTDDRLAGRQFLNVSGAAMGAGDDREQIEFQTIKLSAPAEQWDGEILNDIKLDQALIPGFYDIEFNKIAERIQSALKNPNGEIQPFRLAGEAIANMTAVVATAENTATAEGAVSFASLFSLDGALEAEDLELPMRFSERFESIRFDSSADTGIKLGDFSNGSAQTRFSFGGENFNLAFALANADPSALALSEAELGPDSMMMLQDVSARSSVQAAISASPITAQTAQASNVVGQVQAAIIAGNQQDTIEVRLDPPELGRIKIDFSLENGDAVKAVLGAERAETLDYLRRNIVDLEEQLKQAGFGSISFDFQSQNGEGFDQGGQSGAARFGDDSSEAAPMRTADNTIYLSLRENAQLDLLL